MRCDDIIRLIIASSAGSPASADVWDAGVYYLGFTTDTNQFMIVTKTSWMEAHLHQMPLRLSAPDPTDLRALFQIVPIRRIAAVDRQEMRWHLAQILPRLRLTPKKRAKDVSIIINYLQGDSSVIKMCSM